MVTTERHLWLNLTGIKDRDKVFLLDAPMSPFGLFGDKAKRHAEAFDKFLPAVLKGRSSQPPSPNPVRLL